jgi:aldose 1-epimerase
MANISKLGTDHNGNDVFSIILESDLLEAQILNFGATLKNLRFLESGSSLVLGYQNLEEYLNDKNYAGVTIGRYANRISNGRYFSNSKQFDLDKNECLTTLHGGSQSCHNAPWLIQDCKRNYVELAYQFKDGDMGFGGDLSVNLRYDLNGPNLRLTIEANTSESSLCNFTNHSYFNLGSSLNKDIFNHKLLLKANKYLEVNSDLIPTGKLLSVERTKFDFLNSNKLSSELDHCWVLDNYLKEKIELAAVLVNEKTGRKIEVYTDEPGIQVYTGNNLDFKHKKNSGICLETQHFPNSPNQPNFPSTELLPGEVFKSKTIIKLINT